MGSTRITASEGQIWATTPAWGRSSGKLRASVRSLPVGGRARSVRQQSSSGAPAKPPLHGRVFNRVRRTVTQNCFLHRYETVSCSHQVKPSLKLLLLLRTEKEDK